MLKKKKLMLAVALPILILGVGYKETRPAPVNKDKIKGTIYVLPAPFLLNLQDGRYAKLTVGLQLAVGQSDGASATASASSGESAVGTLPEEPLVREIVTDTITNQNGENLVSEAGRKAVKRQILKAIEKQTDDKVEAVLIPDLTVQ
jgi:flagellar basal body-associated protein FliL